MKTLQIVQPGVIRLTDTPEPAPGPGEIKVKIHYAGFCGSDLNTFRGANAMVSYPRIPGHEIGASIEALGSDVPDSFKPGQIVTLNPTQAAENASPAGAEDPTRARITRRWASSATAQ